MQTTFANTILTRSDRLAMPIGVYAGLEITGANVRQAVSDPAAQSEAVLALHERFGTAAMLTAMDLSAEAETFGCQIRMEDDEIPTVIGRRAASQTEVDALPDPAPGDLRTAVHLETARRLAASGKAPVFGGCIGPFSLAGRIFGVSEAMEATALEPDLMLRLLEKVTRFLRDYVSAFRQAGAAGVIMAEPAAGLLSPRGLGRFSSAFVKQIVDAVQTPDFVIILHNCGAKLAHLPKVLESGAEVFHFGEPMDLPAALAQAAGGVILGGNLDPTSVFHSGTPQQVRQRTLDLLEAARPYPAFFISSGCDIPPGTPVANMDAFYAGVRDFR